MKPAKSHFVVVIGFLFALAAASVQGQWLPQPATGSGPIYYNGGNVGIGTSTPGFLLHILWSSNSTNPQFTIQNTSNGTSASAGFQALNDTGVSASFGVMGSAKSTYGAMGANSSVIYTPHPAGLTLMVDAAGPIKFATGNSSEKMRLDPAGNLGIGTPAPAQKLDIEGAALNGSPTTLLRVGTNDLAYAGSGGAIELSAMNNRGAADPVGKIAAWLTGGAANLQAGDLVFSTASSGTLGERLRITSGGNVGIGTISPASKLSVNGVVESISGGVKFPDGSVQSSAYPSGTFTASGGNVGIGVTPANKLHVYTTTAADGLAVDGSTAPAINLRNAGTPKAYIGLATGGGQFFSDAGSGDLTIRSEANNILLGRLSGSSTMAIVGSNVGVGTTAPTERLMVAGNIRATGNISADGTIYAKYQDVAEWVSASRELPPATVVVLDPSHDDQVMPSARAYDTAVAGVVSANPGMVLGAAAAGKEKIATTGRVLVKVDATRAPVAIGDLLVTSDIAGVAMKSEPLEVAGAKIHRPGTVIGKALQSLQGGRGEILVLLSLQ